MLKVDYEHELNSEQRAGVVHGEGLLCACRRRTARQGLSLTGRATYRERHKRGEYTLLTFKNRLPGR